MDIFKKITSTISKTGRLITLQNGGETYQYFAVVQPIHDKSKLYLESSYSSLGKLDKSHALYYGPCDNGGEFVHENSVIIANSVPYSVKISEKFFYKEESIYIWAVLQRSFDEEEIENV